MSNGAASSSATMEVAHLAVVVKDLTRSLKEYDRVFGPSRWELFDVTPNEMTDLVWDGKPLKFSIRAAIGTIGNLGIELIQPLDTEENPFADFLEERGEGMHHILIVDPEDRNTAPTEQAPLPPLMTAKFGGKATVAYLGGVPSVGMIVETTAGEFDLESLPNYEVYDSSADASA